MGLPFHPATVQWFSDRLGLPTDVQARTWPVVAGGGHVLVTAPTGTGKTLAAFMVAVDRLLTQAWPTGGLRVLYVSPLKALNNDIRRNLLVPLAELRERFDAAGLSPPQVEVAVRSGDTPEDERRRLRRRPPEILITTPESLNILLTQPGSGTLFGGLRLVILDEIHAVIGSKRGTALLTALERLVPLAGEFQRIGLSATVNPADLVARALGGFRPEGDARSVTLVSSPAAKAYEVKVVLPEFQVEPDTGKVFWESLALELRRRVKDSVSTLIFTNSRRACEKLTRLINENQDEPVAYSHHGSLSKEIRHEVEEKLKTGDLRALVATNSLELGIDVGDLDEVILAQTPRTASSAIQKVGRAGHRIGQVSRARLYPSHGLDLVEAAVIVRCIREQAVEPLVIPEGPLDVLAQTILSSLSARPATADELYSLVRCSWPYRHLNRRAFELVVEMLAGRYSGTRIPELKPRIEADPATGAWSVKSAVPFLLYSSGGTIPDRGYFTLRDFRTGTALGELDEEFVWERALGDRFALGAQVWKITAMDDQAVRVEPVDAPPHIIPFWKAEDQDRSWFLAERIGLFLAEADGALAENPGEWKASLVSDGFSTEAADRLASTLIRERQAVGALPHRWRLVIERVAAEKPGADRADADQYVLHTFWGARVNRPWAFALAQAWEDKFGYALETYPGDDQILVLVPPETDLSEVLALVTPANLEELLRRRLEATGYFGARFREGAGRALLLPKPGFDKRTPLWQTRLKAKRLFEAVAPYHEFPILLEAWRQCLRDEFDLEALKALLDERSAGRIETWNCRTAEPSPFTEGLLWRQINEKMYEGDDPPVRRPSELESTLWNQLLASDRPLLPRALIMDWESRWGRTAPGYAPETPADLTDFLEVRIALSAGEWEALVEACVRDTARPRSEWDSAVTVVRRSGLVGVPAVADLWSMPQDLWLRWLEGRGPLLLETMERFWSQDSETVQSWVRREEEKGTVVRGALSEDSTGEEICLARTWDQMVRRLRLDRRGAVPVRPAAGLPLFLAQWQGLVVHPTAKTFSSEPELLQKRVGQLLGLPLSAELWESAVLPGRTEPYHGADFDRLFIEGGLRWFGAGQQRIVLGFPDDREAFLAAPPSSDQQSLADKVFGAGTFWEGVTFADLASRSGLATGPLTEALWSLAWEGLASSTTFGPLRQGLRSGFRYESGNETGKKTVRGFQRWSSARSSAGTWVRWKTMQNDAKPVPTKQSPLERLEEAKHRSRLVLERYGIVFRALLAHEGPGFQWKVLFPALRLMELSGEIVGGLFWDGIPGLQFATPEALRTFSSVRKDTLWVQHAQDPSSLCGLGLEAFPALPRRAAGTWLWWKGSALIGTLSANGRKLELASEVETADVLSLVKRTSEFLFNGKKNHWSLEIVNNIPAAENTAAESFLRAGFRAHGEKLILWKEQKSAP
jgi:ATP-dependent Lhr-like helicase